MGFKKSTSITGKFKNITTDGINFYDGESGETLMLPYILYSIYGNEPFEISVKKQTDDDIALEGGEC